MNISRLRRSRRHVDWEDYDALHKELVAACRAWSEGADGTDRRLYQKLGNLILPWLTPKTLAQADREILFSLLICCRQADQELDGMAHGSPPASRAPSPGSWGRIALLLVTAAAVSLILFGIARVFA